MLFCMVFSCFVGASIDRLSFVQKNVWGGKYSQGVWYHCEGLHICEGLLVAPFFLYFLCHSR